MNEITLAGCTPAPLASYLKALGVLRLLSTVHPQTRAAWRGGSLLLEIPWEREALENFFLNQYQPTPILAPWNGGSGFYTKDNKAALTAILQNTDPRLDLYRECLSLAEHALADIDRSASPKNAEKAALLTRLRGLLPDAALDWFDAAVLLTGESAQYPPLLGTGGNDGRLDFTNNFMQRLLEALSFEGTAPEASSNWLKTALYGDVAPGLVKKSIGQFSPGQVGGPNAANGFEADSIMNPWDFVLMIEGALTFAAAAVRRNADDPDGVLSYPFTVRAVGAGAGSLGEGDAASARGELWMPLWRQPATYVEVRALLSEGRVALGRKPARDALDFVRAVHRLGGYRGLESFQRFGLLMRSGKAYLATPLSRVDVTSAPKTEWLDDLDDNEWLTRFRRFAQGDNVAKRFLTFRRQLEDTLFDLAGRHPRPVEVQALLILLGEIQGALSVSRKAQEILRPIPRLGRSWVQAADDGTAAFRIARALAGLQGATDAHLSVRAQLFPVHPVANVWLTPDYRGKHAANDVACRVRIYTEAAGSLPDRMIALLRRRLSLAEQMALDDRPMCGPAGVTVDDLLAFLRSDRMDRRIADLFPALSLCGVHGQVDYTANEGAVPAAFSLLKLCVTPTSMLRTVKILGEKERVPTPPGLVQQLAAGNAGNRAVRLAWRRLIASGPSPVFSANALPELGGLSPSRVAAALLIPLDAKVTEALGRSVLRPREIMSA